MTGLFGAWGASVGGGSAGQLYGEVKEFGFWDLSQSIYTDGKGPDRGQPGTDEPLAAATAGGDEQPAANGGNEVAVAGSAAGAGQSKQSQPATAAGVAKEKDAAPEDHTGTPPQQQQQQQQPGFLYKLFSSAKGPTPASQQPSKQHKLSSPSGAEKASGGTSTPRQQQQQQHVSGKSPLHICTHRQDSSDEDGELPQLRSQYIQVSVPPWQPTLTCVADVGPAPGCSSSTAALSKAQLSKS
jgi:hypothetical protein